MDDSEFQTPNEEPQIEPDGQSAWQKLMRLMKGRRIGYWAFISSVLLMAGFLSIQYELSSRSNEVANPSNFTKTDLGDGWIRYEKLDEQKFAISLPATWNAEILNTNDAPNKLQEISKDDLDIANRLKSNESSRLIQSCMKMYASDGENQPHQSASSLNILVLQVRAGATIDSLMQINLSSLDKSILVEPPKSSIFQPINGEAYEIKSKQSETLPDGEKMTDTEIQFSFLKDQLSSIVTIGIMGSDPNMIDQKSDTFEKIGKSFEWLQ